MGTDKFVLPMQTIKALRLLDEASAYILFLALHTYAAHGAPRASIDRMCAMLDALPFPPMPQEDVNDLLNSQAQSSIRSANPRSKRIPLP